MVSPLRYSAPAWFPQDCTEKFNMLAKIEKFEDAHPWRNYLCEMSPTRGTQPDPDNIKWLQYSGMGEWNFLEMSGKDKATAGTLLNDGRIASSLFICKQEAKSYRWLHPTEELSWGKKQNGDIVQFYADKEVSKYDTIQTVDPAAPAVQYLQSLIGNGKAIYDTQTLKIKGEDISPTIFDANVIRYIMRRDSLQKPAPSV